MSVRPPRALARPSAQDAAFDAFGHEIMAEKAAALGRAGETATRALARLAECERGAVGRNERLRAAARAVHAWFIQREVCGLRRHHDIIRDCNIPREVLVRLGAG